MATGDCTINSYTTAEERILCQLGGAAVRRRHPAISSLPLWVKFSIITAGVLFLPVFAFFLALLVEILLGLLMEARLPTPLALVIGGAVGWFLFRNLLPRTPGNSSVKDEGGDSASDKVLTRDVGWAVIAPLG